MGICQNLTSTREKKGTKVERDVGRNVVKYLTQHIANSYRHVYFDNYFNSIPLLLDLLQSGLYGCGTINTNRKGLPEPLKLVARRGLRERGDSIIFQCKQLTVILWQDKQRVLVAATNADPTSEVQVLRKNKDGSRAAVRCPPAVALYNRYMGGVDRNDQLRGYYHVRLKMAFHCTQTMGGQSHPYIESTDSLVLEHTRRLVKVLT